MSPALSGLYRHPPDGGQAPVICVRDFRLNVKVTGGVFDFQFALAGNNPENRRWNLFAADCRGDMPALEFCRSTNGVLLFVSSALSSCRYGRRSSMTRGLHRPRQGS
jgi:hypothetical protein